MYKYIVCICMYINILYTYIYIYIECIDLMGVTNQRMTGGTTEHLCKYVLVDKNFRSTDSYRSSCREIEIIEHPIQTLLPKACNRHPCFIFSYVWDIKYFSIATKISTDSAIRKPSTNDGDGSQLSKWFLPKKSPLRVTTLWFYMG